MDTRPVPVTALAAALTALVLCLLFGNETFLREVVLEVDSQGAARSVTSTLAAPSWETYGAAGASRFTFVLLFPLAVGALVVATARRGTVFAAVWTATVAAGAVAGFLRGFFLDEAYRYMPMGGSRVAAGIDFAGTGATFGLLVGWLPAVVAALATVLVRRRSGPDDASTSSPYGAPPYGGPPPWAPPGTQAPGLPWAPPPAGDPTAPAPPSAPGPGVPPSQDPTRPA